MRDALHNALLIAAFLATGIVLPDPIEQRLAHEDYNRAMTGAALSSDDANTKAPPLWNLRDQRFRASPDEWRRVYCVRFPHSPQCEAP